MNSRNRGAEGPNRQRVSGHSVSIYLGMCLTTLFVDKTVRIPHTLGFILDDHGTSSDCDITVHVASNHFHKLSTVCAKMMLCVRKVLNGEQVRVLVANIPLNEA